MLLYLAATYNEHVEEHKLDLYSEKAVSIPRSELYVVYAGERGDIPDTLLLSSLYEGAGSVEIQMKVLRELSLDREAITQKLASKFSLPPQTAAAKVAEYWEQ